MTRPPFTAFHRPCIVAGVQGDDPVPLSDWTRRWEEARDILLAAGLAFYVHSILVISPIANIEMETTYG
jgi:hypothetical protein